MAVLLFFYGTFAEANTISQLSQTIEPAIYLSENKTISGSINEYTGNMNSGSSTLTLTGEHDFLVGQGIIVQNASSDYKLNHWLRTTVTAIEGNTLTLATAATQGAWNARILHDDTEAVNRAISGKTGNIVFDFDHLNVMGVKLQSNTRYIGYNTTLYVPSAYSNVQWVQGMITTTDVEHVIFEGFVLDGGKTRDVFGDDITGVALFLALDTDYLTIRDSVFQHNHYIAVDIQGTMRHVEIRDNKMYNTDVGILAIPEWRGQLTLENAVFRNNIIKGGSSEGISIESGMYNNTGHAKNVTIIENTISDKVATGIQYGGRTIDIEITGNYIYNTNNGITTRDENLEAVENMITDGATIMNNRIRDVKYNHMILDGKNIFVDKNEFINGATAILLGRGYVDGIHISENDFINLTTSPERSIVSYKVSNHQSWGNEFR